MRCVKCGFSTIGGYDVVAGCPRCTNIGQASKAKNWMREVALRFHRERPFEGPLDLINALADTEDLSVENDNTLAMALGSVIEYIERLETRVAELERAVLVLENQA